MRLRTTVLLLLFVGLLPVAIALHGARAIPVVRHAGIGLHNWPEGAAPVRIVLASDIHMGNMAMSRARLAEIVAQINAERPDLILLAGDFIAGHASGDAARVAPDLTPLADLRAPLGVVAVLGNHDHWTGAEAVHASLARAGITVLSNRSIAVGPIVIGGLDDQPTGHASPDRLLADMEGRAGARIVVAHSPDIAATLPPDIELVVAGHTHCGQIVLPVIGAPVSVSRYGDRYACGLIREGTRTTVVTAGVGTSVVPVRWNAPPDIWTIRVGPVVSRPRS